MKSPLPPLKRFGQNFLIDKNIILKIIKAAGVSDKDNILEIGPGRGALTFLMAEIALKVLAVEIDRGLCADLAAAAEEHKNINIFCRDILKFDLKAELGKKNIGTVKVVANVPYNITTPIIEYLFRNISCLNDIFIMVQREFAGRMTALPGSREYGSLSCYVNYFCRPKSLFKIKGASFYPAPKVDSCFVRLKPHYDPRGFYGVRSEALLFKIIRAAFGQRRKRLYGSLSGLLKKEELCAIGCGGLLQRRPEELSLIDFVRLSNVVFDFCQPR